MGILDKVLTGAASSAISGAASLAGVNWQQDLQKELMHENEAINLAQWNRENKYNSPKEQMKRLLEAGLNPDLAIGGSPQNTAANANLTAGTPQAPGAANAVATAVRNAQSAALLDSEVAKNESEANRNNAQAGEHEANTTYKWRSMDLAIEKLTADLGFTKQQTMESVARTQLFGVQVEHLITDIENLHAQIRLTNARVLGQYQQNRLTAANADIAFKHLSNYDVMFHATIDNIVADSGLKDAQAEKYRADTNLLWATFKSQCSYWSNLSDKTAAEEEFLNAGIGFRDAQTNMLIEQIKYLPYQNAEMFMYAEKYFEKDDDGNYVYQSNGLPKIRGNSATWSRWMDQASAPVHILGEAASIIFSFGVGAAGLKGATKGFGSLGSRSASPNPMSFQMNDAQYNAYKAWQRAKGSPDASKAYNRFLRSLDN